jgi:imidazolonepropionase-like amidohydrolase
LRAEGLRAAGLEPLEVLRASTSGSARVLGLDSAIGKLAVGYRADLIHVDGEPDVDVAAVERVTAVVLDGVEQDLTPPGFWASASLLLRIVWTKIWF